jgi:protein-disulfide isomerase
MQNQKNTNSSGNPLLIIGAVFLVVLIAGWWLYSSSKATPTAPVNTSNSAANKKAAPNALDIYAKASPGAQPAHILGSQAATVTVEEFADYQCPTCAVKHPVLKQITSIYNSRIKFVFRNFPLTQMHPKAYDAAVAAESAGLQGKFWDMQNLLFTKQAEWSASTDHRKLFSDYAQQIGLDLAKFQADSLGLAAKKRVDDDLNRARTLQVASTPTVYINGVPIPFNQMTVEGMRQIIDAELQKSGNNPPATVNSGEPTQPANTEQVQPKTEKSESNK